MNPLPLSFFDRPTVKVARELIGCILVRQRDGVTERFMITETEAYDGHEDLASHGSKGRTKRTDIMFGPGGYWYVYLIYGIYWMLNIVTGPAGYPAGILIRGIEGISGPGRVTKALGISFSFYGKAAVPQSGLWIEKPLKKIPAKMIQATTRIGIDYAGPIWTKKEYRFVLKRKPESA